MSGHPAGASMSSEQSAAILRGRRVALLMIGLLIMCLGDLYATLVHAGSIGMEELNPIASYLLERGMTGAVVSYKLATSGLCIGLLLACRRHRIAEVTAWVLVGVMLWLTLYWGRYNDHMADELAYRSGGADYVSFAEAMHGQIGLAGTQVPR